MAPITQRQVRIQLLSRPRQRVTRVTQSQLVGAGGCGEPFCVAFVPSDGLPRTSARIVRLAGRSAGREDG
ncbi:MAG: hypothetical protein M3253_00015 [Chloroflexota bacterium]|nr:hypothetical protein [Chloroflexota bacterium]